MNMDEAGNFCIFSEIYFLYSTLGELRAPMAVLSRIILRISFDNPQENENPQTKTTTNNNKKEIKNKVKRGERKKKTPTERKKR